MVPRCCGWLAEWSWPGINADIGILAPLMSLDRNGEVDLTINVGSKALVDGIVDVIFPAAVQWGLDVTHAHCTAVGNVTSKSPCTRCMMVMGMLRQSPHCSEVGMLRNNPHCSAGGGESNGETHR